MPERNLPAIATQGEIEHRETYTGTSRPLSEHGKSGMNHDAVTAAEIAVPSTGGLAVDLRHGQAYGTLRPPGCLTLRGPITTEFQAAASGEIADRETYIPGMIGDGSRIANDGSRARSETTRGVGCSRPQPGTSMSQCRPSFLSIGRSIIGM